MKPETNQFGETFVDIDEIRYRISYLTGTQSLNVFVELVKILGNPVASVISDLKLSELPEEGLSLGSVLSSSGLRKTTAEAVRELARHLNADVADRIFKTLIKTYVRADAPKDAIHFDDYFQGKTSHLLKMIWVAIVYNYQDVFSGGGDLLNT